MSSQPPKTPIVSHLSGLAAGEIGLPELPLPEEILWASRRETSLPPTTYMLPEVVIASRIYLKSEFRKISEQASSKKVRTPVLESELSKLGLPVLPGNATAISKCPANSFDNAARCNDKQTFKSDAEATNFSALYHYGVDDAALNKVLTATALLIDRMPSQSAVDCLMDMPVWMRTIFLARHGVSNVIGLLLSARLEDSGESSLLSSDGSVIALNKVAPEAVSFAKDLALPKMDTRNSLLTRLTTNHTRRQNGISIKNPNIVVEQTPRLSRRKSASRV